MYLPDFTCADEHVCTGVQSLPGANSMLDCANMDVCSLMNTLDAGARSKAKNQPFRQIRAVSTFAIPAIALKPASRRFA